jgi:hypothetical protein
MYNQKFILVPIGSSLAFERHKRPRPGKLEIPSGPLVEAVPSQVSIFQVNLLMSSLFNLEVDSNADL